MFRQPRNLKHEIEERQNTEDDQRVRFVTDAATLWLMNSLPEDQKAIIRDYVQKYGSDWWRQLDCDTGGMLGNEFKKFGYTDSFLGTHELQTKFKRIIENAVTT